MSLRDLLCKATGTLSGAPKAATPNPHSMEDTIAKMVDLESEINDDIDALVDLKTEIMRRIKRVENTEYQTILELRYLCFKRWEEISVALGYQHAQAVMNCMNARCKKSLKVRTKTHCFALWKPDIVKLQEIQTETFATRGSLCLLSKEYTCQENRSVRVPTLAATG